MNRKLQNRTVARGGALAAGLLAAACANTAQAQSSDALLNKLVEKGILTVKEANDLKEESDKDFNTAYQTKTGLPDWVTALKFNGDFRTRFEENYADSTDYHSRDRFRYRVRFGITATMLENFEVGLRLATGNPQFNPGGTLVGGSPITANQDMNSLESRKFIWVDAAYAKWTPIDNANWTVTGTLGKMDNPFQLSNMVYDADINPEGGALQVAYHLGDKHTIKGIGAAFILDEVNQAASGAVLNTAPPSHDPFVFGGQLLLESKWTPKIETTLGLAAFNIVNKEDLSAKVQPFYNSGNTRDFNGFLSYNYNPIIGSASATYKLESFPLYKGAFPIKLAGEYMNNPAAPSENTAYRAGFTFGKAGHKRNWEVSYRYQRLEGDSWFDAMVDDDNGAYYTTGNTRLVGTGKLNGWFGGTNVKGHFVQGVYSFTDFLNLTVSYYLNDLIVDVPGLASDAGHFMVDLNWKF